MKRGWLLNLVLLIAIAALAWLAWFKPSRDDVANQTLTAIKPSQVQLISLQRSGHPTLQIERSGKHWLLTAPIRARADEFQVLRMLTVLEARPTTKLPATDLARFDLQPPAAQLNIDGVEYAFGGINAVTREQYMMRGDTVYAVELRHGAALPTSPGALIRRVLLDENEQPTAITVPEFSVRKTDGKWVITPTTADLSQDDLQRYIDRWRHASAAKAEPYDGRKPLSEIRIVMADSTALDLGVLQREPQLVLWRRDTALQYLFLAAAGQALLTNPIVALTVGDNINKNK